MNDYSCWFCAENIDRADTGAVMIVVESLWDWDDGSRSDAWQSVYAHSHCAKERLKRATDEHRAAYLRQAGLKDKREGIGTRRLAIWHHSA
ncbi:hypothetical protein TPR58_22225 [Sphingomonas sp. HF-S3]|uniref:Uncharacterized protein n=1 Tax=Sphingomonas rustica TaxID=3103142 RepID=A0ABV0BGV3_9SPHN